MIIAYYISTALLALLLLLIICFETIYGHGIDDAALRLRRRSFVAFFSCSLTATVSRLFTVSHGQIEILPTMTICLDYCSFLTFSMLAAAYFGRQYYKNPYNWFFMLELPIIIIILNTIMRLTGGYSYFYSLEEMSVLRPDRTGSAILMSRLVFLPDIAALGGLHPSPANQERENVGTGKPTESVRACQYSALCPHPVVGRRY